jgi:hypothetical protein
MRTGLRFEFALPGEHALDQVGAVKKLHRENESTFAYHDALQIARHLDSLIRQVNDGACHARLKARTLPASARPSKSSQPHLKPHFSSPIAHAEKG